MLFSLYTVLSKAMGGRLGNPTSILIIYICFAIQRSIWLERDGAAMSFVILERKHIDRNSINEMEGSGELEGQIEETRLCHKVPVPQGPTIAAQTERNLILGP
jgi:hypothetical protein